MKPKFILIFLYLMSLAPMAVEAQSFLQNGGMELWRRRQFRCCGRNVDLPANWGIPEQSCGLNYNKFVYFEEDLHNVHSGLYAAMLYSDTSYFNNVGLQPGMLVYNGYQDPLDSSIRIGQPVSDYGYPIDSAPTGIKFWLKMTHDVSDTFSYMYLFTRWDTVAHREDTLAFATTDVPDTHVPMDQYFEISDSIHYRHAGTPDSVKIIFYGGRFGNPALRTNTTWIDDISLTYGVYQADSAAINTTGIAAISEKEQFTLYPNPATNTIRLQSNAQVHGDMVELYDDLGRMVMRTWLTSPLQAIDVSALAVGAYTCRVLDSGHLSLYQAKVSIVR